MELRAGDNATVIKSRWEADGSPDWMTGQTGEIVEILGDMAFLDLGQGDDLYYPVPTDCLAPAPQDS